MTPVDRDADKANTGSTSVALLSLRGICKAYSSFLANDQVDITIERGQIHGLIGENGAGKSTLVKILYGVLQADSGDYYFDGQPVTIKSPVDARRLGIAMVFQHFSLFDGMTAIENIALGLTGERANKSLEARLVQLAQDYSLHVDLNSSVAQLSVGERQRIEILRCLAQNPKLLVMDEPTSVLTPGEIEALMETLARIRDEGRAVLFISHKLEEVRRICQRVTVLRHGRVVADTLTSATTDRELVQLMTGSDITPASRDVKDRSAQPLMHVRNLNVAGTDFSPGLRHCSFDAYGGEVLGIAGVAGNGQSELLNALAGERRVDTDTTTHSVLELNGIDCLTASPGERRKMGFAYVPEDRLGQGSVPNMSLQENALLTVRYTQPLATLGVIRAGASAQVAESIIEDLDVRCTGSHAKASSLSGGNLQKFILGREVLQNPRVLLVAHPTFGVDAGATAMIRKRLIDVAVGGAAVIVVSHDLDELLEIADRIAVMHNGRLSECFASDAVTTEQLGLLMTGVS